MSRVYEPWPDEENDPENAENWGWWEETPYRISVDGENAIGNVPTPIFEIMWGRNRANQITDEGEIFPPEEHCRWLLWDDVEIAREELKIALRLHTGGSP